ncbi:MAG: thioredoxin domain-containing protein [Patescibacteria group bacterium]|jgi:protein-disulfide isomerase
MDNPFQKKSFFDAFSPRQSFIIGCVASLLILGTAGFISLGVYVLQGGSSNNTDNVVATGGTADNTNTDVVATTPDQLFKDLATKVGLNLDSFNACLSSNSKLAIIKTDQASASAAGVRGTPSSFLINKDGSVKQITGGAVPYASMKALLDKTLGNTVSGTPATTADVSGTLAAVTESDHIAGSGDITIVTYTDFQCPYCQGFDATMQQVLKDYSGKVRWVLRDFPLSFHDQAENAAEAAECAGEQGKYWEYAVALFQNQDSL